MSNGSSTASSVLIAKRRNVLFILIVILSLCGLADSIYLTIEHITGQSVRCTIIAGCSEVLSSSYAVVGGYPLASIGALAYFTVFSLTILALFGYRSAVQVLIPLVLVMCLVSLWLIYLQAFVIHAFCQFCLLSAVITFSLTGLVLLLWKMRNIN
jgi:Predicted membrane protein